MRKQLAAAVTLLLVSCVVAPVTCAGWEPAATDRMACCTRAQHPECPDQTAADKCCAQHEQSRQPGSTMAAVSHAIPGLAVALRLAVFDPTSIEQASATRFHCEAARRLHDPPDPLVPVLRI